MAIGKGGTSTGGESKPTTMGFLSSGKHDFKILERPKQQACILIYGEGKTGKTTFGTRFAPAPIALLSFDQRAEHAIEAAKDLNRVIPYTEITMPTSSSFKDANDAMLAARAYIKKTLDNLRWAVDESNKGNIHTILFDPATEFEEAAIVGYDGVFNPDERKNNVFGKDRDYVSMQWNKIFALAKTGKAHFIVTARSGEIWIKNPNNGKQEATGRFKPKCSARVGELADFVCNIRAQRTAGGRVKKEFELEMIRCGANIEEQGAIYTEKDWGEYGPFVWACYNQFINTSNISDWE